MSETPVNIILIEDEQQIRRFVMLALEGEGLHGYSADTGRQGLIEIGTRKPDVVILDLGLPDMDGIDVIRQVRSWSSVPIIVLSARTQEAEPFGTPELLARLRAQLRRRAVAHEHDAGGIFNFGDVQVDLPKRQVQRALQAVHLTPIEFRLLGVLIRNAGRVVTQRQLLKEVWGPAYVENGHYLRIYMANLRQKLEQDAAQPRYLLTETGVGYRLVG